MSHTFRTAVEALDIDAVTSLLAADVVFNSPVAFHPFRGREDVTEVLRNVMEVFADFSYVDAFEAEGSQALVFSATIGGREVEGVDYLVFDEGGYIRALTVFVRPLSGVIALAEAMGPRVAHLEKG
jgi:hypothetical protein